MKGKGNLKLLLGGILPGLDGSLLGCCNDLQLMWLRQPKYAVEDIWNGGYPAYILYHWKGENTMQFLISVSRVLKESIMNFSQWLLILHDMVKFDYYLNLRLWEIYFIVCLTISWFVFLDWCQNPKALPSSRWLAGQTLHHFNAIRFRTQVHHA